MIVTFDSRDWEFDPETITLQQGIAIQLAWGFTLEDYENGLEHADARAMQCMYWLMLAQNGVTKTIKELDCDILKLFSAYHAALVAREEQKAAEAAPKPELGPTPPGGPTSSELSSPTVTTRPRRARGEASTASSPGS